MHGGAGYWHATFLALLTAGLLTAAEARAQCGAATSTCSTCHDGGSAAKPGVELWHEDHAFADLCAACHGGRGDASERAAAHEGMIPPLASDATCVACHGPASSSLLARYASRAAARRQVADHGPSSGGPALDPPRQPPGRHGETVPNVALGALVAALLAGLVVLVVRDRPRAGAVAPPRGAISLSLRRPWSPYVAGVGLGLVVTVSMALFGHRLSGAGAYQHLSGYLGRPSAPGSMYWREVVPTGVTWDVRVLLGSVLGAFVAARLAGEFAIRTIPDRQWSDVFGPSVARRWLLAFVGSVLTEIAGGIAGGCTASLAVSGGAVLAPGAFVFMAGMFGGGIPTAWLIYRRRPR
jgi:hypothetical protein